MTTHWTADVSERSPLAGRRRRDILSCLCKSSQGGDACRGSMRPRGLNAVGYKLTERQTGKLSFENDHMAAC